VIGGVVEGLIVLFLVERRSLSSRNVNRTVSGREEISFFKELSVVNAAGK
jgi:hypothetical protein